MPYNDNQLFYAALYWTEALPGGKAFTDDICKKHGKPYMPMNASQQTVDTIIFDDYQGPWEDVKSLVEAGVTETQCEAFFEAIYASLKEGKFEESDVGRKEGKFFDLGLECERVENHSPFSEPVEHALQAACLPREVFYRMARLFVHDNGYTFCRLDGRNTYRDIYEMAYPGRPDTGYRHMSQYATAEGSPGLPLVSVEFLCRLIELEAGKTYTSTFISTTGKRVSNDFVAEEGDFYHVAHAQVADIWNMSDEEILSGGEHVYGGVQMSAFERERYQPGFVDETYGYTTVATDDPRIVRQLEPPARCMDVTEKIVIGWGGDLQHAEPGDKILFKKNKVVCISKERLESGKTRLVDVSIGHDAVVDRQQLLKSKAPKPKMAGE